MSAREATDFSQTAENGGPAQRSSNISSPKSNTKNNRSNSNSKRNAPLSPMIYDEKKDDDLLNESGCYDDNTGDGGGRLGPNRITCDGIASNMLTCGATDTAGKACVIL
jgi:hypothetical protein